MICTIRLSLKTNFENHLISLRPRIISYQLFDFNNTITQISKTLYIDIWKKAITIQLKCYLCTAEQKVMYQKENQSGPTELHREHLNILCKSKAHLSVNTGQNTVSHLLCREPSRKKYTSPESKQTSAQHVYQINHESVHKNRSDWH